jgi:hypothetical protein
MGDYFLEPEADWIGAGSSPTDREGLVSMRSMAISLKRLADRFTGQETTQQTASARSSASAMAAKATVPDSASPNAQTPADRGAA